ncbi:MAG TPA: hypothetical protein PKD37_00125 [Oligoflexia bacterium]|nr:hypothetical protein [Oligoflexia bacterium]HMP26386.1 hypothetical protein [Oligoflexia bacterium]
MDDGIAKALARIKNSQFYEKRSAAHAPFGFFRGRFIIGGVSKFIGGVYVSPEPHEAVVVDGSLPLMEKIKTDLINHCENYSAAIALSEEAIFNYTVNYATRLIPLSHKGVKVLSEEHQVSVDDKVSLDVFIEKEVGAERHQVLLAGFLLEALIERKLLRGMPCISHIFANSRFVEILNYTTPEGIILTFNPLNK